MTERRTPGSAGGEKRTILDRPLGETRRQPIAPGQEDRPQVHRAPQPRMQGTQPRPQQGTQPRVQGEQGRPQGAPSRPMQNQPGSRPMPRAEAAPRPGYAPSREQNRAPERRGAPQEMRVPERRAPRTERIDPNQPDNGHDFRFQERMERRKRKRRLQQTMILLLLVLLVLGGFAGKLAFDLGSGADTFYEGVTVDGVKLNGYTMEEAKAQLELINAERLNSMTVHLAYDTREWSISPDQFGVSLNLDETLEQAWELGRTGNIFARQKEIHALKKEGKALSTELTYDEQQLTSRLSEVKSSVDTPAVNANVIFDPSKEEKFKITQESTGRSVDLSALLKQVTTQLEAGLTTTVTVKPDVVAPTVFAENLEKATKRIVRTTTDLGSSSDARIHNVKTAIACFNGLTVQPGQEVSFNKTTGPRGLEEGYQNAGVILDDEIVDGPGGGVCQVSTTLYQAVLKANLEVIRSNKHSLPVSYVDVGTDAAVAYDYKDLVFKNNTEYPIFIEGKVSGKTVAISIYGYPLDEGTTVEIVTDKYETIAPAETKIILDTAAEFVTYTDETKVKKKSREGVKVKSYRVIKVNGEEVSRELLRDDYYKEVQGETYQGVTPRPGGSVPVENTGDGTDNAA